MTEKKVYAGITLRNDYEHYRTCLPIDTNPLPDVQLADIASGHLRFRIFLAILA
jgi:hypothetical protein